jgi:lipopolysaccharide biosynthesis glycosyltransferase
MAVYHYLTNLDFFKDVSVGTSSDARYAIFTSPEIHLGMVHYTTVVDPWFHTAAAYNFATAAALLDWLQAGTRIAFIQKARQSPDTPRNLKEQFLKCYQAICADQQLNPSPMTMARLAVLGPAFIRIALLPTSGGPPIRTASDQPCLWCAQKGHTIFDCPSPPTPALK